MSSIEDRVKKIVIEQLGVKEEEVTPTASFVDDLGADSLDTVELVMALEEEFECEIPDEEAEKIWTVSNGEQVMFRMPKKVAFRGWAFSHMIHHRGQLSVYLRQLNVSVPGMYGPSADEVF